jgi:hypothetical protein
MKQHNWYSYLRTLSRGIHWANISITYTFSTGSGLEPWKNRNAPKQSTHTFRNVRITLLLWSIAILPGLKPGTRRKGVRWQKYARSLPTFHETTGSGLEPWKNRNAPKQSTHTFRNVRITLLLSSSFNHGLMEAVKMK